jgi:hypothetical protein
MKIIITENQYYKLSLRRRLRRILDVSSEIIDNDFYGGLDFCKKYPTFQKFIKNMVLDIIVDYGSSDKFDYDEVSDFIYEDVGYENFVDALMGEHGAKIRSFYNLKTKDC